MAKGRAQYGKAPVVIVYKNSTRATAKYRMKVFTNKTIDDVIDPNVKLPGIPPDAEYIKVGVGAIFIEKFKQFIDEQDNKTSKSTVRDKVQPVPVPADSGKSGNKTKRSTVGKGKSTSTRRKS